MTNRAYTTPERMSESEGERRPRPIGLADDSEDGDSDTELNGAAAAAPHAGNASAAATGEPEETTTKKRSRRIPAFSENDLVKDKGLRQIYKDFPKKCRYKGKGREAEFLRGLMIAYKEWGYQLYPGAAFEDLASRTEKLGGRARTRDLMRELRDAERDRVVEAKYGRAAVNDMRAREAAKQAAKENKAVAAREEEAQERADEDLAASRYMEVDEDAGKAALASTDRMGGGKGDKGSDDRNAAAAVLSERLKERMEMNRRLALERLRLKKEAAAAAAAAMAKEVSWTGSGAAAMPVDDGELRDLMDVDGGARGRQGQYDDDEAALADMEAEEVMGSAPKSMTSNAGLSQAETAAVTSPAASVRPTSLASITATGAKQTAAATDAVAAHSAITTPQASPEGVTSMESTILEGEVMDEEIDRENSGGDCVADGLAPAPVPVVSDGTVLGAGGDATASAAADATSTTSESVSGALDGKNCRADDKGAACATSKVGLAAVGEEASADDAATREAAIVPEPTAAAAAKGDDGQGSFSSPSKCRPAGGLPLSPLGNMFASTDEPAVGGSVAVRAPLGGLFSDVNV